MQQELAALSIAKDSDAAQNDSKTLQLHDQGRGVTDTNLDVVKPESAAGQDVITPRLDDRRAGLEGDNPENE